jgi:uncharacterized protein (DUF58 family)
MLKKIKRIEISTRRLVDTVLQGEYLSSFKGRGIEFTEVREYSEGDDVRSIDWNVTARMNAPFVKVFVEERDMQVVFASDMSGSLSFGTRENLKSELMFEFVAAMGFSANSNNDRVGFFGFTSGPEKYVPAKKGRKHILRILSEIIHHDKKKQSTDISASMMFLSHLLRKKSTVFIISDFYDNKDFHEALRVLRHKHDVIAVILRDRADYNVPDIGLVPFNDPETGRHVWLDTGDKNAVKKLNESAKKFDAKLAGMFKKLGIDFITLNCGEPYLNSLITFFKKRERRLRER